MRLDNGRHVIVPKRSVGQLDLLPVELINQVLGMLDIPTLTTFRRVNQRAMHLVDSLPTYRRLWTFCPDVLRAIISINAASFACETLFEALTRGKCESCNHLGDYLYLITCRRVCYSCFTSRKEYFPVSLTLAARHAKLQRKALKRLPQVRSLPGRYTASGKLFRYRMTLIDCQALGDLSGDSETLNKRFDYRQPNLGGSCRLSRHHALFRRLETRRQNGGSIVHSARTMQTLCATSGSSTARGTFFSTSKTTMPPKNFWFSYLKIYLMMGFPPRLVPTPRILTSIANMNVPYPGIGTLGS